MPYTTMESILDADNPEWTDKDFESSRPTQDVLGDLGIDIRSPWPIKA